jgi:hypothetical protein
MPSVLTTLTLTVSNDRPGHRKVMSSPLKDGTPRYRWEPALHSNARVHWRVAQEVKRKDHDRIEQAILEAHVPRPRWKRASVTVILYVRTNGRRDDDGSYGTIKGVLDGLVHSGIIADDSRAVIGTPTLVTIVDKARAYSYTVEVRGVAG